MIKINNNIAISEAEIKLTFIASPGPGGQNVNKVASAVLLRFDVPQFPFLYRRSARTVANCIKQQVNDARRTAYQS